MNNNVIQREWGTEVIWANKENYCAKILIFNSKSKTPIFFNKQKEKTYFVNSGEFKIRYIDTTNGEIFEVLLTEGQTFDVPALMPMCVESTKENSVLAEASNGEFENDDFIVYKAELIK